MFLGITGWIVPQYTHEDDDDQLPARIVVHGASTKWSCSVAPTNNEINNGLLAPFEQSYTKMVYHLIDKTKLIPLELEHDRELNCFYVDPKDIKDMVIGK